MKYQESSHIIPMDKRTEYNEKILYLVNTNNTTLSNEELFNYYTEKGGNHDLIFSDFDNYHEYSSKKKEIEQGQFFTPAKIIQNMYDIVNPKSSDLIADLTAGKGSFINHAPNEDNFYANEIDSNCCVLMKKVFPLAHVTSGSIEYYKPDVKFNVVFGNPPFNIKINNVLSQLFYYHKSFDLLHAGGILAVLVPSSFLHDEFFNKSMIEDINSKFSFICQYNLDNKAFENANIKTKVMLFHKITEHVETEPYIPIYVSYQEAVKLYGIKRVQLDKVKSKIHFENIEVSNNNFSFSNPRANTKDINGYQFKLKKYLFELKQQRPDKVQLAYNYIEKFKSQSKPDNMDYKVWDKHKITENKVIAHIKKLLNNSKHKQTIEQNYSAKTLRRKERFAENQKQIFADMKPCEKINRELEKNYVEEIILTDMQKLDTNKILQKRYSYLQWEQGCGKTVSGVYQIKHRINIDKVSNVFVVAPSIAIKTTWKEFLTRFKIAYRTITKISDIEKIQDGETILLTFNMLGKYQRFLKKHIKKQNYNSFLLMDEADYISNINSKTYKSALNVFRKIKYKTLMSGTMTRNNIAESFTQFELLYNNSDLFKFTPMYIYVPEKNEKGIEIQNSFVMTKNKDMNTNFKPYKKGLTQFKSAYSPEKSTVFGIKKQNQDICNSDYLRLLMDVSIITRTFDEIVGVGKYKLNQITCRMNTAEKILYKKILSDFSSMKANYFNVCSNDRKDRMLDIIRQLNLLFKACSTPHTFQEYSGDDMSVKINDVIKLIKDKQFNKLAIGTIRVSTANIYYVELKKHFPEYEIHLVTGATHSIEARKKLVEQMEKQDKVILISTQQSLSCSISIGFVNEIILPELQWNNSKSSQYYFRFVRFNSVEFKNIYYVTYENSIESNLLQLLMNKEKLNQFLKGNESNTEEMYEKFGVNFDLMDMLLYKEKETDSNGRTTTNIIWKESEIA